jgi:hypothetical protein
MEKHRLLRQAKFNEVIGLALFSFISSLCPVEFTAFFMFWVDNIVGAGVFSKEAAVFTRVFSHGL